MYPTQTIEFIKALLTGWKLSETVMEDGKINFMDIPAIIAAAPALWTGFVGIDKVDDEMAHIDDEGKAEIKAVIAEFVVADDEELEALVEETMQMVLDVVGLSKRFVLYFKK